MGAIAHVTRFTPERRPGECEACASLRESLRMCLGALAKYYGEELERNDPDEMSVSDLVQGGVVLRAERALRLACSCGA
jgi:hypothetical protein